MPLPSTMTPIATTTLASAASEIIFSSITQNYTDIVLVYDGQFSGANGQIALQFNGDTGTNYSDTILEGSGSVAGSARDTNSARMYLGYTATANIDNMTIIQLMNYSNTTTNKTALSRHSTPGSANVSANVGLWRSTAAINYIRILCYNGLNFNTGSTFTLYGIKAA
jgi:hypothetical protein